MKKGFSRMIYIFLILHLLFISSTLRSDEKKSDPGKKAYEILREADSLARSGKILNAVSTYLKASDIYKKALKDDPDNRIYKTNFKYCLGKRGYIQIKEAQRTMKDKKYDDSAKFFNGASKAYEYALKKLPGERNFIQNLKYAKDHGAEVKFQSLLEKKAAAPKFELQSFNGRKITSENLKDSVVLLEFWAGWCPSCKKSMPKLQNLHKRYFLKGLLITAVAMDKVKTWGKYGSEKRAVETAKNHNFSFAWGTEKIANDYGNFNSIPTVILIDHKGNLYKKVSYKEQDEKSLSTMIETLLKRK